MRRRWLFACTALLMASDAAAQTISLVCVVRWERHCVNALMDIRDCPAVLGAEVSEGALEVVGNKARTKNLGAVTEFSVTHRGPNEFELEGALNINGDQVRGWGVLDSATWKLKLVFSQGGFMSGVPGALQRGLEGNCR